MNKSVPVGDTPAGVDPEDERRAVPRYACEPWVPVLFTNDNRVDITAAHIIDVSAGGARVIAPPTALTRMRWGDRLRLLVTYSEATRRARVEGLVLRADVVGIRWDATGLTLHLRFAPQLDRWEPLLRLMKQMGSFKI